jgi:hypothetical protein
MNKIIKIFDNEFVKDLLEKEALSSYPGFERIESVKIVNHKKNIWESTYHVVVEYKTTLLDPDGGKKTVSIYATAHSSEPRIKVFNTLNFLWQRSFSSGDLVIPKPLFYSEYFNATFYEGIEGRNLYRFIKDNDYKEIESVVIESARWFAKLHALPAKEASQIIFEEKAADIIPGYAYTLKRIKERQPGHFAVCREIYDSIIENEKKFLSSTHDRWLIHGDAHPENVIRVNKNTIAVIDFTDFCLSDFARDLGNFTQQLEYMSINKIKDQGFVENTKKLFLEKYSDLAGIELGDNLKARIENYYLWAAFRTSIFFLIGHLNKPERAEPLLAMIRSKL